MATPSTPEASRRPVLLATAVVYVVALAAAFHFHGLAPALTFSAQGVLNVGSTVAPLVAISAFVERAVEIVITATRGPGALAVSRALDAAADDAAREEARRRLDAYRLTTQRQSFAVALAIALFASVVGVRAVAPLLTTPPQNPWFDLFDVTLTSLLLAGGSEGIHQVVTTITTFLDSSKSSSKQRAAGSGPEGGG
jgi:hypothetical protein